MQTPSFCFQELKKKKNVRWSPLMMKTGTLLPFTSTRKHRTQTYFQKSKVWLQVLRCEEPSERFADWDGNSWHLFGLEFGRSRVYWVRISEKTISVRCFGWIQQKLGVGLVWIVRKEGEKEIVIGRIRLSFERSEGGSFQERTVECPGSMNLLFITGFLSSFWKKGWLLCASSIHEMD